MRKLSILAVCTLLIGFTTLPAFADEAATTCSLETLHGTYAFAGPGTDNGIPYTASGRETYDGQGHIKYFELWDEGGVTSTYTGVGTYTITADCVATAFYSVHHQWTYFVAPDGRTFYFNNNNNIGVMSAGHEDRISRALLF